MSVVPVRLEFDVNQAYKWFGFSFLQQVQTAVDNANMGADAGLRRRLQNNIGQVGSDENLLVNALGHVMRTMIIDIRIVPDSNSGTPLFAADIEVLERIFGAVGAEIERRGGGTAQK